MIMYLSAIAGVTKSTLKRKCKDFVKLLKKVKPAKAKLKIHIGLFPSIDLELEW